MKLHLKSRENGSSLFVALTVCLVVGVILAGYLVLTSNRFQMTVRSSDWNAAVPVLEAGVEEALTHMTRDTNQPTANNWTSANVAGIPAYTKTRSFSDGSYYFVYIVNFASNNPTVYAQGFVRSPYNNNKYISRTVKVGVTNPPTVFTHAMSVNGNVNLVGNPVIDAFDSRKGGYNTATNRDASGGIATDAQLLNIINLGGANIYGPIATGPGAIILGGTVGDVAWNASHTGIEPGWSSSTMNVSYPSNSAPVGGSTWTPPTQYTNITSGTYQMAGYSSSGDMTINGNVTIYIPPGYTFTVKGNDTITIKPGASLKIIAGGSVDLGGGGVLNGTGTAGNFSLVGLNTCTSINYHGNAQFIGTVNAPQADFSIKGTTDVYGAIIANSASMNGNTALHYDEALAFQDGYTVNSWQEL